MESNNLPIKRNKIFKKRKGNGTLHFLSFIFVYYFYHNEPILITIFKPFRKKKSFCCLYYKIREKVDFFSPSLLPPKDKNKVLIH